MFDLSLGDTTTRGEGARASKKFELWQQWWEHLNSTWMQFGTYFEFPLGSIIVQSYLWILFSEYVFLQSLRDRGSHDLWHIDL